MEKLFSILNEELKSTIRNPVRILSLTNKDKALSYLKRMRSKKNKKATIGKNRSAWLNWNSYDTMEKSWRVNHASHDIIIDWLKENVQDNSFSILDCGVLSAVTYRKLLENKLKVNYTGIDIAPQIINDCRKRYPEADWRVMDVQQLDLQSKSYDLVLIRHVLEHLPYYQKAIIEAKRVAKEYGFFCLFYPLEDEDKIEEKIKSGGRYHQNTYGRSDFEKFLNDNFSSIEEIFIKDPQRDNQLFICRI